MLLSPDCREGKHRACHGDTWNYHDDAPIDCGCGCHQSVGLVHKNQPCCTCIPTDPSTWTQYGSAVEPGSQLEPNPDCPLHFPAEDAFGITHGVTVEQAVGLAASLIQTLGEAVPTIRRLENVIEQKAIEEN